MYEEKLKLILDQLSDGPCAIGIEASEIVTTDGLAMAARLPDGLDEDYIGPLSAGVFAFAKSMAKEFDIGELGLVIITGSKSSALIGAAGDQMILALKVKSNAKIDQISKTIRCVTEEAG